jgi:hypothetical protein
MRHNSLSSCRSFFDSTHAAIREQGRARWYDWYELVVAEVTRGYDWKRPGYG